MASRNRKYIDIPDHARRDFIKWTVGLGAALGLRPWKVWEVQESIVGPAVAQSAAVSPVNRAVHLCAGNGGLAWFTQFWPFAVQDAAGRSMLKPGQSTDQAVAAGDHPMKIGPDAPKWGGKKMTAFLCGTNETHTQRAVTASTVGTNISMFAAMSALQTASPTLVPSIAITNLPYGTAAGAPAVASVANAAGMVDLFNSAASTAGGALVNANDASLFEAYYKANLSLRRAAARPTMTRGVLTGKVAANLLGKNLASQLRPSAADLTRYGATGAAQKLVNIANALITAVKAFKLNLTSNIMIPAMLDDPHGAFADMAGSQATSALLGKILDTFFADMMAEPDPMSSGLKLGDSLVFTVTGDTYKNPLNPSGWGDGTPSNSNILYVLGAGKLRGGWFGQVLAQGIETWNPSTGANVAGGQTGPLAAPASAAALYAVAKGDMRRVSDFYRGVAIDGVVVPSVQ
jgi:hypothetical protein